MGGQLCKSKKSVTSLQATILSKLPSDVKYIKPLIICGPSGAGKSTLYEHLKLFYADKFCFSVSCTTRKPRDGEVDGVHYQFMTVDQFREQMSKDLFLEHAEVHGNYYGTHMN